MKQIFFNIVYLHLKFDKDWMNSKHSVSHSKLGVFWI